MFRSTVLKDLNGQNFPAYVIDNDVIGIVEGGCVLNMYLPAVTKHKLKEKHIDKLIGKAKRKWGIGSINMQENTHYQFDIATNRIL